MAIVKEELQPGYIEVQRKKDDTVLNTKSLVKDQQAVTFNIPAVVRFAPSAPSNFGFNFAGVNTVSAPACTVR